MKNFKFLLAAAVVFAVGSAFTNAPAQNENAAAANWYLPNDPNMEADDPAVNSFSSYNPSSAHETPSGCNTGEKVCAAQFISTGSPAQQVRTKN